MQRLFRRRRSAKHGEVPKGHSTSIAQHGADLQLSASIPYAQPSAVNAVSPVSQPYAGSIAPDRDENEVDELPSNPAAKPMSPSEQRRMTPVRGKEMSDIRAELLRRRAAQRAGQANASSRIRPPRSEEALNDLRRKPSSPAVQGYVPAELTSYSAPLRRRKALLIGIGYRHNKHLEYLPGCTNDAKHMFALLTSSLFGFEQSSIKLLSDELVSIDQVRAEAPTRSNIVRDMTWLTEDLQPGDSVVFFFAGHGDFVEDKSGDEVETGYDQCIMPVDYKREPRHMNGSVTFKGVPPILDDTIYERLVRSVPGGAKVTAIVDACRSGTAFDLPVMYSDEGPRYRQGAADPPRETARPHKSAGACVLFSGSADHQMSADITVPRNSVDGERESFGIMTRSFIDAVKEMAAHRDPRCYAGVEPWTYGQFFDRVKELVHHKVSQVLPEGIEGQEPQLSSSHNIQMWETSFTM